MGMMCNIPKKNKINLNQKFDAVKRYESTEGGPTEPGCICHRGPICQLVEIQKESSGYTFSKKEYMHNAIYIFPLF